MRRVLAILAVPLVLGCTAGAAEVRVWQGTLTLKTTVEGPPDPNPPFDLFAATRFNYPYTLRENLTGEEKDVAWRALFLENEYLKCTVLPDLGGHLYTCVDKISGQPMFYANPTIKKAGIGYRGAWAAFGVEFNFPVSHNWVSMSPVDFATAQNRDGSASITVGNVDRPYGMQWTVELRLKPGSTVLEQHVTLYNRSDVRHRYYWWNNAGVRVWDDSVICYPMRNTASHGFTRVDTWPVDSSGMDLSVIKNQTKGTVSLFVHGSREPWMGVYHPHTQAGVAHYADYAELPGKKIWSWGVDADGLDWRRTLSDDNSGYVEVQAGLMRNQETYSFLEPRESVQFTEYWMPVRGIGGIARANLAGVLNLRREGGKVVAGFNANERMAGAQVRLLDGERVLYEETADLAPEKTWSHEVAAPTGKVTFELFDEAGPVMKHTEGVYDWEPESEVHTGPQAPYTPTDPLEIGTEQELNGRLLDAYATYTKALERAPGSLPLRLAAGRLAVSLLRYEDAVKWLSQVGARYVAEPEIAYYLGLAYEGLGDGRRARAEFEAAYRMPRTRAAAAVKLAEIAARADDDDLAGDYLGVALRTAPGDTRAAEERILVKTDGAVVPPLNLLRPEAIASDPERLLAVASEFMRLGKWDEAIVALSEKYPLGPSEQKEPGAPLPQDDPIIGYYRAYCEEKLGEKADYSAASKMSRAYVFPNGAQTLAVLEAALRANPNDATAHYLMGNMRMASGLVNAAISEWQTAQRIDPKIPVLQASLGRVLLRVRHDPESALAAFRAGVAADPRNMQVYTGADDALSLLGRPAAERVAVLERFPSDLPMPTSMVYELALSHAEAGQFDKAEALFRNRFFSREEGGTNVRQVWVRVRTLEAAQAACPAALATVDSLGNAVPGLEFTKDGMAPFVTEAGNQAVIGGVEARCGRADAAAKRVAAMLARGDAASVAFAYQLARGLPDFDGAAWKARLEALPARAQPYVRGVVEAELGRAAEARETLRAVILAPDRGLAHHYARMAMGH
jgi:tetratricopeptide (TPR) repeat protein